MSETFHNRDQESQWEGPLTPYAQYMFNRAVEEGLVSPENEATWRKLADEFARKHADILEPNLMDNKEAA